MAVNDKTSVEVVTAASAAGMRFPRDFTLVGTDTAIDAIADFCGFCGFGSDVELRHVFRARTGKSLHQWRKANGLK